MPRVSRNTKKIGRFIRGLQMQIIDLEKLKSNNALEFKAINK
jgi:hypothetical protein